MKKMIFILLIVCGLSVFNITQASAGCNIVWTGDVSGSTPTNETSRTPQARHEAYSAIFGNDYCSGPCCNWDYCLYSVPAGCDGNEDALLGLATEYRVCDTGEWWRWHCSMHVSGPNQCPCPGGCMQESGTWDVVCDSTTTTTPPTVIELASFTATPKAGKISLQWTTESEINNAEFNLYRSERENGEYAKINSSLIPAQGSSTQGASYEFTDTNIRNRKTYYYKLEDIDLSGNSTMHGPVSATSRLIYGMGK
jgi:hypothetical protein